MGRPLKEGLDYMTLDCNILANRKIRLFRADFQGGEQHAAFGILIMLLLRIYGGKGYYLIWDDEERVLFAEEIHAETDFVDRVVGRAIERGIFNRERYESKAVLTSKEILNRFAFVKDGRSKMTVDPDIAIMEKFIVRRESAGDRGFPGGKVHINDEVGEFPGEKVRNSDELRDSSAGNAGSNGVSRRESAQSKVKKSKEKETPVVEEFPGEKLCEKHGPIVGDFCRECVKEQRAEAEAEGGHDDF